ncbi:MAG: hypothetical protein CM1200mP4_0670 [Rhodospirillaceae bacterium]|nr:MAG: hypothetical protein CM1200mP4_0670 [Rhodospirillaceae bacterium]
MLLKAMIVIRRPIVMHLKRGLGSLLGVRVFG